MKNWSLKKLDRIAYGLSGLVIVLVILMRKIKFETSIDFSFLPPFHSTVNALAAVFLIVALVYIKKKNITGHRNAIIGAMICSAIFLSSYVLYHFTTEETRFCQEGNIRYIYFFLLITHIVLSGTILPFIFLTFNRGLKMEIPRHRKMARWVYPLWLYVAISGPICYLMLRPCY